MWILLAYGILWTLEGFWAIWHCCDVDKNGMPKTQWRMILYGAMFLFIPFIAKWCGMT